MKLYYPDSSVAARQNFLSVRVVQLWNKLPEVVSASGCVSAFISRLNSMCRSLLKCFFVQWVPSFTCLLGQL